MDASDAVIDAADSAADATAEAEAAVRAPAQSCDPCVYDEQCGPGGQCDEIDPMVSPSLRHCMVACPEVGAPCTAHGLAGTCVEGNVGPVCRPTSSCIASARNAACPAAGCTGRFSACALAPTAVCLSRCQSELECENGFSRCRPTPLQGGGVEFVCVADDPVGPDQCGRRAVNEGAIGAPCASDPCAAGLACERGLSDGGAPFCTRACESDSACGPNAHCAMISGRRACVPDDCSPFEPRAAETMLDRALAAAMRNRSELFYSRTDLDAFPTNVTRDRFRMPIFNRVHRDWVAGARWARSMGPSLDQRARSLSGAIAAAAGLRANGDALSIANATPATTTQSLAAAIVALDAQAGGALTEGTVTTAIGTLPADFRPRSRGSWSRCTALAPRATRGLPGRSPTMSASACSMLLRARSSRASPCSTRVTVATSARSSEAYASQRRNRLPSPRRSSRFRGPVFEGE